MKQFIMSSFVVLLLLASSVSFGITFQDDGAGYAPEKTTYIQVENEIVFEAQEFSETTSYSYVDASYEGYTFLGPIFSQGQKIDVSNYLCEDAILTLQKQRKSYLIKSWDLPAIVKHFKYGAATYLI
jgi:hypothetical protein